MKTAWAAQKNLKLKTMPQNFVYEFGGRALQSDIKLDGLSLWESAPSACSPSHQDWMSFKAVSKPAAILTAQDSFVWSDPNATLSVHKHGTLYGLVFPDLAVFTVNQETAEVSVCSQTDDGTLGHLLLDQVLPRLLAFSGELVIHAGSVQAENYTFAFLGESGHGKSSMTAGFMQDGAEILSDDAITLSQAQGGVYAAGLYPSLRLWPRAIEALSVPRDKTSDMAHYSTKRRIHLSPHSGGAPRLLDTVFQLEMGSADSALKIEPLTERELMMSLIESSFRLDPTAQQQGAKFFSQIDEIKSRVKGYRLCYPRGYEKLPSVRAAIIAHMKKVA